MIFYFKLIFKDVVFTFLTAFHKAKILHFKPDIRMRPREWAGYPAYLISGASPPLTRGHSAVLVCRVEAYPFPTLDWKKDRGNYEASKRN